MTKKHIYLSFFILIALLPCSNIKAINVENKRPTPEEMQAKKWEYLQQEAKLTPEEAEAVKPLFLEYENKVWELHEKCRMGKEKKPNSNYEELNENYIKLETEQAEFLKDYHAKLKKVLTPEKLFYYYHAERGFKRHLIFEMQEHRKHKYGPGRRP